MRKPRHVVPITRAKAIALASGSNFSGSVTDATSGKPIPGAIVTVGTKVTRAGANGQFHIEGNGPAVNARAYGYGRSQVSAPPESAQSLQLKLSAITPHAVYLSFWGVGTASVREPIIKLAMIAGGNVSIEARTILLLKP
ncbi:MAG: carboxypeptidase-like regulatory domain-containing protein [Acidobacteriota bacterium]|nr:carboxypeptidase-like regulatory domain-containing protein [Acidobacteriota bacterium]MDQ2843762.1 carboxypeptidase-like regulatory domain-containing protein [Acidobacteriota bacterium]